MVKSAILIYICFLTRDYKSILPAYGYLYIITVLVSKDPWLLCPSDVATDLTADQSSIVLGSRWQHPRTNMKKLTVTPSYLRDTFPFPAGITRVTWTAISDSGEGESCFYYVIVNGRYCA